MRRIVGTAQDLPRSAWLIDRRGLRLAALMSALLLGLAAIVASSNLTDAADEPVALFDGATGQAESASEPEIPPVVTDEPNSEASRRSLVVLVIGALALVIAGVARVLRRRDEPPEDEDDDLYGVASSAEAVDLLDELLRPHHGGETPRQTIVRIYAALETGLGRAHLARRPHETPGRFVYRILGHHDALRAPLRDLVRAFEIARFSKHPVTEAMRDQATAALARTRSHYAMHEVQAPTRRTWAMHQQPSWTGS